MSFNSHNRVVSGYPSRQFKSTSGNQRFSTRSRNKQKFTINSIIQFVSSWLGQFTHHSMISIGLMFITSELYVVVRLMTYLLHGGQLGIFIVLLMICMVYITLSIMMRDRLIYGGYDFRMMIQSALVTLICLCGYVQSLYRTGVMRLIPVLVLIYVMAVYRNDHKLSIVISIGSGILVYLIFAWTLFPSLNR